MGTAAIRSKRPGGRPAGRAAVVALVIAMAAQVGPSLAGADTLEVVGSTRATHLQSSLTFRVSAPQARLSEIRVRSGSLALHLEAVEIVYADGHIARTILQQSLPPGHQSRAIRADPRRPIREILITKRPGMRPGETMLQLLGKVIRKP